MNFDFIETDKKLSVRESIYWNKIVSNNTKIGTELEFTSRRAVDYSSLNALFNSSRSRYHFGKCGVEIVTSDGSINRGAEIKTSGRRVYGFLEQYNMFKNIIDKIEGVEPFISGYAGFHNHMLLDYSESSNSLEMDMPHLIYKNFIRIIKYYYPALSWITSTIPNDGHYTRYNYFCSHDSLRDYDFKDSLTSLLRDMPPRKYSAVNLNYMRFNEHNNTIPRFHVELRFADGNLFPAHASCITILYKALLLKAVSVSKYGTINLNYEDYDKHVFPLYKFKNGGDSDSRLSNNSLTRLQIENLIALTIDMVSFLEKEICSIDLIAHKLLLKFATEPPSVVFKRKNTSDYRDVNDYYDELVDELIVKSDESLFEVLRFMENYKIIANTEEEWIEKASEYIACKEPLDEIIDKIKCFVPLIFLKGVGFIVKS